MANKILIASDIHGSAFHCRKLIQAFYKENADILLLLGDILDGDYEVADMLNNLNQEKTILCVRGNCDYPEDQAMFNFPIMAEYCVLFVEGKRIFASHGHRDIPNLRSGDIFLHGHTHFPVWNMNTNKGYLELNPGSVSRPRRGSINSYMTIYGNKFLWKNLDGEIYHELIF